METHNCKSVAFAAGITNTINTRKDAIGRLKAYVGGIERRNSKGQHRIEEPDSSQQFEWTPCRFQTKGWKYQEPGKF